MPLPSQKEVNDFCRAAARGNRAVVEKFIEQYGSAIIDRKIPPREGNLTALMMAAMMGKKETVALLLDNGARLDKRMGGFRRSAFMIAAAMREHETVALLLERGAHVNEQDKNGRTALILAMMFNPGERDMVALLLGAGADINIKDKYGYTAEQYSTEENRDLISQVANAQNERRRQKELEAIIANGSRLTRDIPYKGPVKLKIPPPS